MNALRDDRGVGDCEVRHVHRLASGHYQFYSIAKAQRSRVPELLSKGR
jgi:hypothetical protein